MQMIIFISIVLSFMTLIWFYVWERLILTLSLSPKLTHFLALSLVLSFILQIVRLIFFRRSDEHPRLLLTTYFLFGLMIHLFFAALFKDLLVVPLSYANILLEPRASLWAVVMAVLANLWGTYTALSGPEIKEIDLYPEYWPIEQDGYRIVQVSDLHVGPIIRRPYVEQVVQQVNALKPDLIACTGDMGDGDVNSLHHDLEPLRGLQSKHGAYFCPGNHEYYWDGPQWFKKIEELGIRVLLNHGLRIKIGKRDIWLGGVHDYSAHRIHPDLKSDPALALKHWEAHDSYRILLAHQPKSCYAAHKAGFHLMLSGHTHAGQFFPFSLIVGWFNPYIRGLNAHHDLWVYVNVGTGFWGPPLRLGVPSEITLIRLRSRK